MVTRTFSKLATTHAEQVALLRLRGMSVPDEARATFYLQHLNYYRLAAYWLPFEADHTTHAFRPGTDFDSVLGLYVFDRELRLLLLDAIERIEVSVRSRWAYELAHAYGPHAHLDPLLGRSLPHWHVNVRKLKEEVHRSDETFIKHLRSTYSETLPPIWAVCEVMSLGLLSRWYGNLPATPVRRAIAFTYAIDDLVLASWLHHLSTVRNVCAHHSRLWNRDFTVTPKQPRTKPVTMAALWQPGSRRIYNTLLLVSHLMEVVAPESSWRKRLVELLARQEPRPPTMGFPPGWQRLAHWQP